MSSLADINKKICPQCNKGFLKPDGNGHLECSEIDCDYKQGVDVSANAQDKINLDNLYQDVIKLMKALDGTKKEKKSIDWWNRAEDIRSFIKKCEIFSDDVLYQMLEIADLTRGFTDYVFDEGVEKKNYREKAEIVYSSAKDYIKKNFNEKAKKIKVLIKRYEKLRNRKARRVRNVFVIAASFLAVFITATLVCLSLYSPAIVDDTGVTLSVPKESITVFDKRAVRFDAEKKASDSVEYVDAKNALRQESEKFLLYDLSLFSWDKKLEFEGSVKVGIPVPQGFDTTAVKIYYIASDEEFSEMPSTLSEDKKTLYFETDHFSLYAIAERQPKVSYDTDGAGEIESIVVERDTLTAAPATPKKIGYTFGGWLYDGKLWNFSKDTVKKDMTLKAKWIANVYTVTLVSEGEAFTTVSVSYGGVYSPLAEKIPEKSGFHFVGWYTASSGGELVNSESGVTKTEDHTLYARFAENMNSLLFAPNGGEGEMAKMELATGSSANLPECVFTRVGYDFLGWSTSQTGDVEYEDKENYTMGTLSSSTLYAVWQRKSGKLILDPNGGVGDRIEISLIYEEETSIPSGAFNRSGYELSGFSYDKSKKEAELTEGATFTMGENAEYVLYAVWSAKKNTLKFNSGCGAGEFSGTMANMQIETDSTAKLPTIAYTRPGYTFIGWATEPGGAAVYNNEADYTMGSSAEYILYACWKGDPNAFVFHKNGGEGNMVSDFTIPTGGKGNLPPNTFYNNGYNFLGWSTDPHASSEGDLIRDKAEYSVTSVGEVNLYAIWDYANPIKYQIVYHIEGEDAIAPEEYAIKETENLTIPEKRGYDFAGWYKTSDFSGEAITSIGAGSYGHIALYGRFVPHVYNITLYLDGKIIKTDTYTIESPDYELPTSVDKPGYDFEGFFRNEAFGGDPVTFIPAGSTGDKIYYAMAVHPTKYIITFNSNGGSEILSIEYYINSAEIDLSEPTKYGETFCGWYTNADLSGEAIFSIAPGTIDNLELYARWEITEYDIIYETMGGKSIANGSYTKNDTVTLATPTRKGYTFIGWYTSSDYSGSSITEIEQNSTGRKIFYAKWKLNEYTITLMLGGEIFREIVYDIEDVVIDLPTPEESGKTFEAWYESESLVGITYKTIVAALCSDITLYGKMNYNQYTINFVTNGGEGIDSIIYNKIEEVILPTSDKVYHPAYNTVAWYDNAELSGSPVTKLEAGSTGNKIFYAKWSEPIEFTATLVLDGEIFKVIPYNVESDAIILADHSSLEGYEIGEWYSNSSYSGEPIVSVTKGSYGNKVFYAKKTPIRYSVSFIENTPKNGALTTDKMQSITCIYGKSATLSPNTLSVNGWIFKGWSTSSTGNVVYEDKAEIKNLTSVYGGNVNLYAVWEVDPFTVGKYVPTGTVVSDTWSGGDTYSVFNTVESTPRRPIEGVPKIIVDWSMISNCDIPSYGIEDHVGRKGHIDIDPATEEIVFVGDPLKTYLNLGITLCSFRPEFPVLIRLSDFNLISDYNPAFSTYNNGGTYLTVDVNGKCSIGTSAEAGIIFNDIESLTFTGSGELTVTAGAGSDQSATGGTAISATNITVDMENGKLTVVGGNGANPSAEGTEGGDGGVAINAETVTVKRTASLNIVGGAGGEGGDYTGIPGSSRNGNPGAKGGDGGVALKCNTFRAYGDSVFSIVGGRGGDGGKGEDARNKLWGSQNVGGKGGSGGSGACAIEAQTFDIIKTTNGVATGGQGGNGGTGGRRDTNYANGTRGAGGDAGAGAVAIVNNIAVDNLVTIKGEDGQPGSQGSSYDSDP